MGKFSFDFDDTIDRFDVQVFAHSLVKGGHDVWIVTSRPERYMGKYIGLPTPTNDDVFKVADDIGISKDKIVFTNHKDKIGYLSGRGFDFHLDDSPDELMKIYDSDDNCLPMNVDWSGWEEDLRKIFNL